MKILMVTMAMDIGGAETHILELSRKLVQRGLQVTVASNGGAYEDELRRSGIEHVKIPCHSKNPRLMIKSYKLLKELIFRERFDVVHAHARIPAFLCSLLHKKYGFRFVTTVHGVYNPSFPYNVLTRWGDRDLVVSEDIKEYLKVNYNIPDENIRVTINGIDLDKFSPDTDHSDIESEFDLTDGVPRIVHVSRLDTSPAEIAYRLVEIMPSLDARFDGIECVIVGSGNEFESVKAKAEKMNAKLGRRAVIMAGRRTDINKFASAGDVFVGVSRAALEGMACAVPAVLAGAQGYIGVFDESVLDVSIDTNFCCRGCGDTTSEAMLEDITKLLNMSKAERTRLGEYGRETVRKYYSIDTMADDALKLYVSSVKRSALNDVDISETEDIDRYLSFNPISPQKKKHDVMISGYYGFGNMGDDSVLDAIIAGLKKKAPSVKITVLTRNPKQNEERFGVRCISRFNLFNIIREMRSSRVLISGGGTLFQDSTSSKSLKYYAAIINLARLCGMKTFIYANGVGSIRFDTNRRLTAKTVSLADKVSVRDESSFNELACLGVDKEHITLSADPAFMMDMPRKDRAGAEIARKYGLADKGKYFIVSLRRFEGIQRNAYDEEKLLECVLASSTAVAKKYSLTPVFVSMQSNLDNSVSAKAAGIMKERFGVDCVFTRADSMTELVTVMEGTEGLCGAEFVCSMRLHTLIYACRAATPFIGLSVDPKIDAFVRSVDNAKLFAIPSITEDELIRAMSESVENKSDIKMSLKRNAESFKTLAEADVDAVLELLK